MSSRNEKRRKTSESDKDLKRRTLRLRRATHRDVDDTDSAEEEHSQRHRLPESRRPPTPRKRRDGHQTVHLGPNGHSDSRGSSDESDTITRTLGNNSEPHLRVNGGGEDSSKTPPSSDHETESSRTHTIHRHSFVSGTSSDNSHNQLSPFSSSENDQLSLTKPLSISTSVNSVSVVLTPLSPSVVSAAVNCKSELKETVPENKCTADKSPKAHRAEDKDLPSPPVDSTIETDSKTAVALPSDTTSPSLPQETKETRNSESEVSVQSESTQKDQIKEDSSATCDKQVNRPDVLKCASVLNSVISRKQELGNSENTGGSERALSLKSERDTNNRSVTSNSSIIVSVRSHSKNVVQTLSTSSYPPSHIPGAVGGHDATSSSPKGSDLPSSKNCVPVMSQLDKTERSSSEKSSSSGGGSGSSSQPASGSNISNANKHSSSDIRTNSPRTSEAAVTTATASSVSRIKGEGDKKSSSNLPLERHEPIRLYRDSPHLLASGARHVECLNHGLMHPAGISHSAAAAVYPRVASLPQHSRAPGTPLPPSHLGPYGLSSHLLPPPHVPAAAAPAGAAPPGSHMDPREHAAMQSQAYRQIISQHPLLPPNYGNAAIGPHVGCVDIMWQQKYGPNHWTVLAQYEEIRLERERAMAQERERSRLERDRRDEQDRIEREKAEREKAEKERQERERQEKERQQRERQERDRLERVEREERERAQREAVQQHFEESLRLAMQKQQQQQQQQQKNMGWSYSLPMGKSQPVIGRSSPTVNVSQGSHSQSLHPSDHDREKSREKEKERMTVMEARLRQDQHERWINHVQQQQRNEQVAASLSQSHPQNFSSVEPRQGGQPKQEIYPMSRSSPHAAIPVGHPSNKSSVPPSPVVSTSAGSNPSAQHKSETSFSLYGYQPFQHTYITHAQLKAREETKGPPTNMQSMAPGSKQAGSVPPHKLEKDSILYDRPPTPGSNRSGLPMNQGSSSSSSKHQLKMMHPGQERSSPKVPPSIPYQPLVGSGGAFKPYEYSSSNSSPAPPAHQSTSSPTIPGRIGSHYPHSQQDQPQNLVKGDLKGNQDQPAPSPQSHAKYESRDGRQPMSTPPGSVPSSYTPPYTVTKSASPAANSNYAYSLVQQGLVPNPLYTAATHSGASTTSSVSGSASMTVSSQAPSKPPSQAGSPPVSQQYPRATPGSGITSGTPVCRSSSVQYAVHQGRGGHSYSPVGPGSAQVINPNRTPTPQEAHINSRAHIPSQGSSHRSPSPAHVYGTGSAPQSNTPPSPLHSRGPPNCTSPRISTTPNAPLINRGPMHPGTSPVPAISPPQPSSTPEGQVLPLNLQGSNSMLKRKTLKDMNGRKRQKTNDDLLLPPQLHPQVHPSSSPPVRQLGTPPQLISNTPTPTISHLGGHSQQRPLTPGGYSGSTMNGSEAATTPPAVMPDLLSTPNASANTASSVAGYTDSYRSFVNAGQEQSQLYLGKHAKVNKSASESPTPADAVEPPARPASNASSTASVTPAASGASAPEGSSEETSRVTVSPALSASSTVTSASSTGSSSNHTKLKKAWLQRHSENEDKKAPTDVVKVETNVKSQPSETVTPPAEVKMVSSPVSTAKNASNPSPANSKESKTTRSGSDGSLNGHENKTVVKSEGQGDDDSTSSASEAEQEVKQVKRKTRISRKQASSSSSSSTNSKRQKVSNNTSESASEDPQPSKKEKDNKKKAAVSTAPVEKETTMSSRRRGRKTKGRNAVVVVEETQKKKSPKPPEKPSIAQLKKTGESFLQDGPCCEVAPRLPKCRECRMTPHQRSKKMPNIFCRFYAYRKLRYGKNGTILGAGFSEPSDATEEDLKLWLPPVDSPPAEIEVETSKFLLTHVADQFCDLVEQEKEAQQLHMSSDGTVTWKRVVQGVREMCDVCETTLFNIHWVCHKCGFVVCIDCYKARKNNTSKDDEAPSKDRDEYQWLLCSNRQPHEQEKLMLTQIIASSALWDVGKTLHDVRRKWNIPTYCNCSAKDGDPDSKHSANGICKLMSAVTKCLSSDKDSLPVNGSSDSPRVTRKSSKGTVNGVVKQEDGLSGYSSESGGSPLSWLADVALNSSSKIPEDRKKKGKYEDDNDDDKDKFSDSHLDGTDGFAESDDDERSENFSTLRELLIRPTGKMGGKNSGSNSNSQKTLTSTLDEVISCVIEQRVRKSDKKCKEKQLLHFTRRHQTLRSGRELLPIRSCLLAESSLLYPDVPHVWLGSGKILLLKDPDHKGNMQMFQEQWKRGQPVIVADVGKKLDSSLWSPESFLRDFGDVKIDLLNCQCGTVVQNQPMKKFWEGFDSISKRMKDEDAETMVLKLKDWPPNEEFSDLLPARYQDLMKCLPLNQYTNRDGIFNMASRLPDCFVRPDLGPRMYNAYGFTSSSGKGSTNLHLDISDAVNVLAYVGVPRDGKDEDAVLDITKELDDGGCDSQMKKRTKEKGTKVGALWHIYNARDADKIRDLLNKVTEEQGAKCDPHHDPIHSQEWYLDEELRNRLYKEYGVEGYVIAQCHGDAIFIPAGSPHQVRNLHSCVKVSEDFVSPESIGHSFFLTQEIRNLSDSPTNHEDKLQIKNIIYHAVKDALALLQSHDPEDSKT